MSIRIGVSLQLPFSLAIALNFLPGELPDVRLVLDCVEVLLAVAIDFFSSDFADFRAGARRLDEL